MWILENNKDLPGVVHYLPCNTLLKVTRATHQGHVPLSNDKSISREHATLFAYHEPENLSLLSKQPKLVITDCNSKYGTYINENIENRKKIQPSVPINLGDKDRIRFGILSNIWCVRYSPFVVTSSQVSDTSALAKSILTLGGHLVSNWVEDCSLLIMKEIILTIKTVCALAACKEIVTPSYIFHLQSSIENRQALPKPSDFLPPIKEVSIGSENVLFAPNEKRKNLFTGKKFIFCHEKILKKMKTAVRLAGGTALLLTQETFSMILQKGVAVVKPAEEKSQTTSPLLFKTLDVLTHNKLHCIPESDIGLAILYMSTEGYCNPSFNIRGLLRPTDYNSQTHQSLQIYATETQDMETQALSTVPSRTVIPESGQSKKSSGQGTSLSSVGVPSTGQALSTLSDDLDTCISEVETQYFSVDKENLNEKNFDEGAKFVQNRPKMRCNKDFTLQDSVSQNSFLEDVPFNPKFASTPVFLENCPTKNSSQVASTSTTKSLQIKNVSNVQNKILPPTSNSGDNSVARATVSIPFEPSTLPSLRMETDSQSLEGNFGSSSQERFNTVQEIEADGSIPSLGGDKWLGKRERTSPPSSPERKRSKKLETPLTAPQPSSHHEFAVPSIPPPQPKTKPPQQDKTSCSEFTLPVATTRRRGMKRLSSATNDVSQPPQAIKKSLSELEFQQRNVDSSQSSREEVMPSHSEKPFLQATVKEEPPSVDDVDELEKAFEKSLVVVQLKSLVKKASSPPLSTSCSSFSSSSAPNFKKFRKSLNGSTVREVSVLPQIIGGCDLFVNRENISRVDEFMASQPALNEAWQTLDRDREQTDDAAEREFNLPIATSRKARTRAR